MLAYVPQAYSCADERPSRETLTFPIATRVRRFRRTAPVRVAASGHHSREVAFEQMFIHTRKRGHLVG